MSNYAADCLQSILETVVVNKWFTICTEIGSSKNKIAVEKLYTQSDDDAFIMVQIQ